MATAISTKPLDRREVLPDSFETSAESNVLIDIGYMCLSDDEDFDCLIDDDDDTDDDTNSDDETNAIGNKQEKQSITYNLSKFLHDYSCMGSACQSKLEDFIQQIDNKVQIDITKEIHKPILNGIDCFVEDIYESITASKHLEIKEIVKTGSLYAGTRVGHPYEADILFKIQSVRDPDSFRKAISGFNKHLTSYISMLRMMYMMTPNAHKTRLLTRSLEGWNIRFHEEHKKGMCLSLVYYDEHTRKEVGVQMDLIPCCCFDTDYFYTNGKISLNELTRGAKNYFQDEHNEFDLNKYYLNYDEWVFEFDTGWLEHQILERLSCKIKCGYRAAKYLLQTSLVRAHPGEKPTGVLLGIDTPTDLFGYKPLVASHILQVFLLQLLMKIHGTVLANELTSSQVTLCLLDILHTTATNVIAFDDDDGSLFLNSPIIQDRTEEFLKWAWNSTACSSCVIHALDELSCSLLAHADKGNSASVYYQMLNHPDPAISCIDKDVQEITDEYEDQEKEPPDEIIDSKYIHQIYNKYYPQVQKLTFTGFCRGPSATEMASAHSCTTCMIFYLLDLGILQALHKLGIMNCATHDIYSCKTCKQT